MDILLAQSGQGGAGIAQFLPFVLILLVIYFLMIRPQAKQQKEKRKMLENLVKGDQVVTSGGIYGTIMGFKEKNTIVVLSIGKNVSININKSAISNLVTKEKTDKKG